jgi:hypothetical protein
VVVGDDRLGTGQWQWAGGGSRREREVLKRRSTIILHGSTTQKTALNIILAAVRTWNLTLSIVFLCDEIVIVLAIGPKFHGFKPGLERWISNGDKHLWHDFLRPHVVRFYGMLKIPWGMIEALLAPIQRQFLAPFLPASLLGFFATSRDVWWMNQKWYRTEMGSTIDQKMVAVAWDAFYDTTQ